MGIEPTYQFLAGTLDLKTKAEQKGAFSKPPSLLMILTASTVLKFSACRQQSVKNGS
jgi:hypothetical protein